MHLPPPSGDRKSAWGPVGELSALAMTLALCVIIGLVGGRWVGKKLGAEDVGTLAGVAFGVVAAGYELRRVARRLQRYTDSARRDRDGGADG